MRFKRINQMRRNLHYQLHRLKLPMLFLTTIGIFIATSELSGLSGLFEELKVPPIYHAQAIDIAMKATGFEAIPKTIVSARREALADDNTPLIRQKIINRPIWRVTIQNVNLNNLKPSSGKETNPNVSGFDVIVDAKTGQMLKVVSLWNAKTQPKEEIRVLISDQELDEKFRGNPPRFPSEIPESLPEIPFLQVLETIGGGTHATHIEAIYVGDAQKRKWIIIQHGVPVSVMFNDIGKDIRRVRYDFVDAKTGEHSLGGGREGPPDYDKFIK